ncbi:MAG: ASCH domain-containing protein [Clostridia bacterium]|nr:ASCH domain-containing protein [Clostridia bacterium]
MKALIIKQPWIDYILEGKKTWEIRGCKTNIRGQIELIQSGSGLVVGSCEIVDCKELTLEDYACNSDKHNIAEITTLPYKRTYAWIIANAKRYNIYRKYKHPQGAIIWVNL